MSESASSYPRLDSPGHAAGLGDCGRIRVQIGVAKEAQILGRRRAGIALAALQTGAGLAVSIDRHLQLPKTQD